MIVYDCLKVLLAEWGTLKLFHSRDFHNSYTSAYVSTLIDLDFRLVYFFRLSRGSLSRAGDPTEMASR